ncbi:ParB/RepB/Spo0J family partition protein [Robbsia andropogonis]|uniref:ParB/RepB/Spo0J family partition protein n=1 Tax=Robbsia andropogonis TaxID=28092 RepID=UPI002A69E732|nr:ParB N-terminal domain-containing protein [Robbsia andropogonis]
MSTASKQKMKAASIRLDDDLDDTSTNVPSPPRTAPGQLMGLQGRVLNQQREIEELRAALASAKSTGTSVEIPLDMLIEVPGRRRFLTSDQQTELRENLRSNRLVHPISVRPLDDGKFEIVSGHNRVDQYRALGRDKIRAVPEVTTAEEAAASAFFANLMQSELSDYEKFKGFKDMQERHPGMSQAAIAQSAGVRENVLTMLLSFGSLPSAAHKMLDERPDLIGANAAYALAGLTKEGKNDAVVQAIERLARGEIDQSQAVRMAKESGSKPKAKAVQTLKIRAGRATYCDLRISNKTLRIDFQSEEEAARVHAAVQSLLEIEAKNKQA